MLGRKKKDDQNEGHAGKSEVDHDDLFGELRESRQTRAQPSTNFFDSERHAEMRRQLNDFLNNRYGSYHLENLNHKDLLGEPDGVKLRLQLEKPANYIEAYR